MRKIALVLVLSIISVALHSQDLRKEVADNPYLNPDKASLTVYGDAVGFEKLYSKIDTLLLKGEGKVNIVHMGGSHVQGGYMTAQLRDDLMNMRLEGSVMDSTSVGYLNGGLGMTFPFVAAKTNTPATYRSARGGDWTVVRNIKPVPEGKTLGLTGISVTTTKPEVTASIFARQGYDQENAPRMSFNLVDVLGSVSKESIYPVITLRDTLVVEPVSCTSDSIWHFELPYYTDSIKVGLNAAEGSFTLNGLYCTNDQPGFEVSAIGVNGASLVSYLRCKDFTRDLSMLSPDLVILGIGINDASGNNFNVDNFISRYCTLCDMIRSVNPECAIIFITNNDSYRKVKRTYVVNQNGPVVQKAFHTLARKYDAAVWDLFDLMGGLKSMARWESASFAKKDKIHFTVEGYTLLGDVLYNAIVEQYQNRKGGNR